MNSKAFKLFRSVMFLSLTMFVGHFAQANSCRSFFTNAENTRGKNAAVEFVRDHLSQKKPFTLETIVEIARLVEGQSPAFVNEATPATIKGVDDHQIFYSLSEVFGYKTERNGPDVQVHFPSTTVVKENLENYVDNLNRILKNANEPEFATVYALQGISKIHPFQRSTEVVAQLISRAVMTEMNSSTHQLERILAEPLRYDAESYASVLKDKPLFTGKAANLIFQSERRLAIRRFNRSMSRFKGENLAVPAAHATIGDSPFPETFKYDSNSFRYDSFTNEARTYDQLLYYGRPAENETKAIAYLRNLFVYGRSTRGAASWDVASHIQQTKTPSGFFQTSEYGRVSLGFAGTYGILTVIDPRGAEVLKVDPARAQIVQSEPGHEGEVLFARTLNPRRVVQALIVERIEIKDLQPSDLVIESTPYKAVVVRKIFQNPNYEGNR